MLTRRINRFLDTEPSVLEVVLVGLVLMLIAFSLR